MELAGRVGSGELDLLDQPRIVPAACACERRRPEATARQAEGLTPRVHRSTPERTARDVS